MMLQPCKDSEGCRVNSLTWMKLGAARRADAEADLIDRHHPEAADRVRGVVGRQGDGQLAAGKDPCF